MPQEREENMTPCMMPTVIFGYQCPDCGQACYVPGPVAHQHLNGEWIRTEDVQRFYQFLRWQKKLEQKQKEPTA